MTKKECVYQHRVSYGETDTMGVLYYGEYFHIFERARSEFIRQLGMSYSEMEKRGVYLPVRNASCRYKKSARYDELLDIHVQITELGKASISFSYQILYMDAELAHGSTQHAFVNHLGKPCPIPQWFLDLLQD